MNTNTHFNLIYFLFSKLAGIVLQELYVTIFPFDVTRTIFLRAHTHVLIAQPSAIIPYRIRYFRISQQ